MVSLGGGDGSFSKVPATKAQDQSSDRSHAHLKAGHGRTVIPEVGRWRQQIMEAVDHGGFLASQPSHIDELQVP